MKQKGFFGFGEIKRLERIFEEKKAKNIFFVCGRTSFEKSGARKSLKDLFKLKNYTINIFDAFSPNPKIEEIGEGLEKFEEKDFDIIVAIGGGSSIDLAKAIKLFYFEKHMKKIPLVAIPTTAGTGSESTHFIVYYNKKKKISSGKENITLPEYFICDPNLIKNLSKKIKASAAMDALGQAIESYWSINSNIKSKKLSKKAIKLIVQNVAKSIKENDEKANKKLMLAANFSGKAINIAKTTACHAISYPLTSHFGILHGHAVIITLPEMLEYNFNLTSEDCNDKRGVSYVKETINEIIKALGVENIEEAKHKIKKLVETIGLETNLRELRILKKDFEKIIENVNVERITNNPREMKEDDIKKILNNLLN